MISIYLDERVLKNDSECVRTEMVVPNLAKMRNPAVANTRQTLTTSTAGLEVAQYLGVPVNASKAELRRIFNADDGTAIYLGEVTYRGDFIHLEMDLKP